MTPPLRVNAAVGMLLLAAGCSQLQEAPGRDDVLADALPETTEVRVEWAAPADDANLCREVDHGVASAHATPNRVTVLDVSDQMLRLSCPLPVACGRALERPDPVAPPHQQLDQSHAHEARCPGDEDPHGCSAQPQRGGRERRPARNELAHVESEVRSTFALCRMSTGILPTTRTAASGTSTAERTRAAVDGCARPGSAPSISRTTTTC